MPFKEKYNTDLKYIITLIDQNKINGNNEALEKFKIHINEVIDIGRFSIIEWKNNWRKTVYDFGEKFKDKDPVDFLKILTELKENLQKDQKEVIDFYYSEIDCNSLPIETSVKRFEKLIDKYPYNPEFRNTLGHFYLEKYEYEKAIEQYEYARIKDKNNPSFKKTLFDCYRTYLESLLDSSNYEKGLNICGKLIKEKTFWGGGTLHNVIIGLQERFKDYLILNEKIEKAEKTIKEIIAKETQNGQMKIIEILGFFTAIIAFIFSTISIGKNFNFNEAIIFNISLGITLLIFVFSINLLFSRKPIEKLDYRILLIIVFILSLLLIVTKFGIPIWI